MRIILIIKLAFPRNILIIRRVFPISILKNEKFEEEKFSRKKLTYGVSDGGINFPDVEVRYFSELSFMRTHQYRDIICTTCTCRHMSAEDIFDEVKKGSPKIGRATVYRNIEAMAENGVLRRFPGINGKTYYECNDASHAHIVDERSGIFCDFPIENISIHGVPEGYEVGEVRIEIRKKGE